jgi:hypothetical protein
MKSGGRGGRGRGREDGGSGRFLARVRGTTIRASHSHSAAHPEHSREGQERFTHTGGKALGNGVAQLVIPPSHSHDKPRSG